MKNKLSDLNDHLFMQLERLGDEELAGEKLNQEVERAKAIVDVAGQIVGAASLQLKAAELVGRHGQGVSDIIPQSVIARQIEHRKVERAPTAEEREHAEIAARRAARARLEEQEEAARQAAS